MQLAVTGKLIPHLLSIKADVVNEIQLKKDQLIKDKLIKKEKPLISFPELNEIKVNIPSSWKYCRLGNIASVVRGGSPRPAGDPRYYGGNIPFLKVADITSTKGKYLENYTSSITEDGLHKTRLIKEQTVLLTNSGATLGVPAISSFNTTFNDGVAAFIFLSEYVDKEYLWLYLKSKTNWFLDFASRGQGQPNLNTDIIRATWFPLPPLEEQKRIVAKVDQLMTLCDQLEQQLTQSYSDAEKLMQATVKALVA